MTKTKKQILAEFLMSRDKSRWSAQVIARLSDEQGLGVQVKTLNSDGDFVIKFSSRDTWIKPSEWLHNYQVSVKERYEEAEAVYHSLFPQEDSGLSLSEDEIVNLKANLDEANQFVSRCTDYADFGFYFETSGDVCFEGNNAEAYVRAILEKYSGWSHTDVILAQAIGQAFLAYGSYDSSILSLIEDECKKRRARAQQKA